MEDHKSKCEVVDCEFLECPWDILTCICGCQYHSTLEINDKYRLPFCGADYCQETYRLFVALQEARTKIKTNVRYDT